MQPKATCRTTYLALQNGTYAVNAQFSDPNNNGRRNPKIVNASAIVRRTETGWITVGGYKIDDEAYTAGDETTFDTMKQIQEHLKWKAVDARFELLHRPIKAWRPL
jgi:hypothetical protein